MPFAGELLQVSEGENDWAGAIERRLHGLGLTILVNSTYYERVSDWVNSQSLRGRIGYIPILNNYKQQRPDISPMRPSLVNKVDIRNSTEFYDWLQDQLLTYHDLTCCDTVAEFRRESYAITREGQIKAGKNGRHEKDDRTDIHDTSRYILGWSNVDKVNMLSHQLTGAEAEYKATVEQIGRIDSERSKLNERQRTVDNLTDYTDFARLDWPDSARRIEAKTTEKKQLESDADELRTLRDQLEKADEAITDLSKLKESKGRETGKIEGTVWTTANDLYESFVTLNVADEGVLQAIFPDHEQMLADFTTWLDLINEQLIPTDRIADTVRETLVAYESPVDADKGRIRQLANDLPKKIERDQDRQTKESQAVRDRLVRQMGKYRAEFPAEAADVSDDMQDMDQYEAIFNHLTATELARHEERFHELLQKGTIQEVLVFKTQLEKYDDEIAGKINLINEHLRQVSYNAGTYIELTRNRVSGDVAEQIDLFRHELRACLSETLGEDNYSEGKYLQVKQLLDRMESTSDEDQRWTERVTDVRQWYTFGASERHTADQTEKEFYSDSGGKSGGQKEKLAYTVLASAIAYQFGLNENRPRTFRFVMIDEAFGRGSDESTRHGLELFRQMNIQLLIVTPLQKINIIEHYINAVHFVSNETGQHSQVRTISKTEYETEKARHADREAERGPLI